jgi:hypothetical protein
MAKPVILTAQGGGSVLNSTAFIPNRHSNPFNIGFGAIVTGTVTYSVQHTFDDPLVVANPNWFNHNLVNGLSASADGNYAFPVAAIRLLVSAGTGSVQATIIQAGITD